MEGLRVIAHREGSASYEGSTPPHDLYNTNFSVWECIIIIGVGVGARRGGSRRNRSRSGDTFLICRIMSIMLNLLLCNIKDLADLGPVMLHGLYPVFTNSPKCLLN